MLLAGSLFVMPWVILISMKFIFNANEYSGYVLLAFISFVGYVMYKRWSIYKPNFTKRHGTLNVMSFLPGLLIYGIALTSAFPTFTSMVILPIITVALVLFVISWYLVNRISNNKDRQELKFLIEKGEKEKDDLDEFDEQNRLKLQVKLRNMKIKQIMSPSIFRRIKIKVFEFYTRFRDYLFS